MMNSDIQAFDTDSNCVNLGQYSEEELHQIEREGVQSKVVAAMPIRKRIVPLFFTKPFSHNQKRSKRSPAKRVSGKKSCSRKNKKGNVLKEVN